MSAAELFLRWTEEELPAIVEQALGRSRRCGCSCAAAGARVAAPPPTSAAAMQLSLLAQTTIQTIERYYLAIALLIHAGSGEITQKVLEERCQLMAQRMTMLYGFNSPEFFDRTLFANYIDLLRARDVVRVTRPAAWSSIRPGAVAQDADELVLSEQLRHSILQVTHD